ncbi:MAG: protein kinase [Myxococcaceae bacterium]|nr:protein kinase [Myxococcaceae bacterium]
MSNEPEQNPLRPIPPGADLTSVRQAGSVERFGKYSIVGPLARGGMAELSLAVHEAEGVAGFSKVVALKRVLPALTGDERYVQMFLDEARLAAGLDHANIVRIYDVGHCDGRYYLTMEYLPGEDLHRAMTLIESRGELCDPDVAAAIISAAAEGLHFAHEVTDPNGVPLSLVHRDVSPSNIIVTYYGQVKIVDFGIAKAGNNGYRTEGGMMKGKPAYFAPEQVTRAPVDRRTDVYGLGIVLWELLAGRRLFMMDTLPATLAAAAVGEIFALRTTRPEIDPALEAIVIKALAREPDSRFQTAAEMHEALEDYLSTRTRQSTKDLGAWLQAAFGERRAQLKKSMARGVNLRLTLDSVLALDDAFAELVSGGSQAVISRGQVTSVRRPWWHTAVFGAAAAVVMAVGALASLPQPAPAPATVPAGALAITSVPPGAMVFLGGEPTGKVTPATFAELPTDVPLDVQLQHVGFDPVSQFVTLKPGETVERTLRFGPAKP